MLVTMLLVTISVSFFLGTVVCFDEITMKNYALAKVRNFCFFSKLRLMAVRCLLLFYTERNFFKPTIWKINMNMWNSWYSWTFNKLRYRTKDFVIKKKSVNPKIIKVKQIIQFLFNIKNKKTLCKINKKIQLYSCFQVFFSIYLKLLPYKMLIN